MEATTLMHTRQREQNEEQTTEVRRSFDRILEEKECLAREQAKLLRENTAQHEQATAQLQATHAKSMQRQASEQNARVVQKQQELDMQRQEQREEHEQTTEAMALTSTAGGCDFTIKTGDHVIYVNREALRSCSQYFQTEITAGMTEYKMPSSNCPPEVLGFLLKRAFANGNEAPPLHTFVMALFMSCCLKMGDTTTKPAIQRLCTQRYPRADG
jgi:hypothetical protein